MEKPVFKWLESGLETRLYIHSIFETVQLSFEPFLYQTTNHINTQSSDEKFCFRLFRRRETASVACIYFLKDKTGFISPARAPFGGIQCDENCKDYEIAFFLRCIENWLAMQKEQVLILKTAPNFYHTTVTHHLLSKAYETAGYMAADKFVNHHIQVSQSSFSKNITAAERRRLAKCKKSGFCARLYHKPDTVIIYNFIKESRIAKGYVMSMSFRQLDMLLSKFPEHCKVFIVTDKSKIIALTVTILVCKKVLYNFLPADLPAYKSFSPTVYLIEAVYDYCQTNEISALDLGISTDHNGIEKPDLLNFKKNLGGIESLKITYKKKTEAALDD